MAQAQAQDNITRKVIAQIGQAQIAIDEDTVVGQLLAAAEAMPGRTVASLEKDLDEASVETLDASTFSLPSWKKKLAANVGYLFGTIAIQRGYDISFVGKKFDVSVAKSSFEIALYAATVLAGSKRRKTTESAVGRRIARKLYVGIKNSETLRTGLESTAATMIRKAALDRVVSGLKKVQEAWQ